jgi:hypothetical protein
VELRMEIALFIAGLAVFIGLALLYEKLAQRNHSIKYRDNGDNSG